MKEREVMKRLYDEYSASLKSVLERIEAVEKEKSRYHARSSQYKNLYNRKRRLMVMYDDTFRWREMVERYIKAWEE